MNGHDHSQVELVVIKRLRNLGEPTKVSRLPSVKHGVRIVPVREDSRSRRSRVVEVHSVVQAEPERTKTLPGRTASSRNQGWKTFIRRNNPKDQGLHAKIKPGSAFHLPEKELEKMGRH